MSFIEVKNISKTFKVAKKSSGIKEAIKSFIKREYHEIKAVDNISFSIKKGEIIPCFQKNAVTRYHLTTASISPIFIGIFCFKTSLSYTGNTAILFALTILHSGSTAVSADLPSSALLLELDNILFHASC